MTKIEQLWEDFKLSVRAAKNVQEITGPEIQLSELMIDLDDRLRKLENDDG